MRQELVTRFAPRTEEEIQYLSGNGNVDFSLYMEQGGSVINNKKLLTEGQLITLRQHARFMNFPRHSHDFVEVMYVLAGQVLHKINGESIAVKAGELLFLGQHIEHEIEASREGDIAINFIILPEFFDSPLAMLRHSNSPLKSFIIDSLIADRRGAGYMHFCVSEDRVIQNTAENLILTLLGESPNKYTISSYTMGLLFLHLSGATESLTHQSRSGSAMLEVLKYIDENYREGSLAELAERLHYDYSWLSREIKSKTGKTYTALVQEKRIRQAAFLLENTDMNILDVAMNVGYENISHFFTLFQRTFHKTPRAYRKAEEE